MLSECCMAACGEASGKQGRPPGHDSGHGCQGLDWGPRPRGGSRDGEEEGRAGGRGGDESRVTAWTWGYGGWWVRGVWVQIGRMEEQGWERQSRGYP